MKILLQEELTKTDKDEIKKIAKDVLEKNASDLIKKDKDTEKVIKSIVADVLEDFYKTLWVQRNFWKRNIK